MIFVWMSDEYDGDCAQCGIELYSPAFKHLLVGRRKPDEFGDLYCADCWLDAVAAGEVCKRSRVSGKTKELWASTECDLSNYAYCLDCWEAWAEEDCDQEGSAEELVMETCAECGDNVYNGPCDELGDMYCGTCWCA